MVLRVIDVMCRNVGSLEGRITFSVVFNSKSLLATCYSSFRALLNQNSSQFPPARITVPVPRPVPPFASITKFNLFVQIPTCLLNPNSTSTPSRARLFSRKFHDTYRSNGTGISSLIPGTHIGCLRRRMRRVISPPFPRLLPSFLPLLSTLLSSSFSPAQLNPDANQTKNDKPRKINSVLPPPLLHAHPPYFLQRPPLILRVERAGDIPYPDSSRRGEGECQGPRSRVVVREPDGWVPSHQGVCESLCRPLGVFCGWRAGEASGGRVLRGVGDRGVGGEN